MKMTQPTITLIACIFSALLLSTSAIAADPGKSSAASRNDQALKEAVVLLDQWQGNRSELVQAKSRLDSILGNDPRSVGAHREYVRYHIMSGNMSGGQVSPQALAAAEASLNTALRLNPNDAGALVLAGHLYYLQQRYGEARTALTKADTIGTDNPWLQLNWADLLMSEGKPDEAGIRYQRVIDARPDNAKVMTVAFEGMIDFYAFKQRPDDVERTYRAQIAFAPSAAWPHGNYALFLLCTRDNAEAAVAEYKKALSIMNYGMARTGLAAATWRLWAHQQTTGQVSQAMATRAEAQKLSSGDPVQLVGGRCGDGAGTKAVQKALGLSKG